MSVPRKPLLRRTEVWVSLVLSALLHVGVGFWVGELWQRAQEQETFRARLAYRPRFKPRRLTTVGPAPLETARRMSYVAAQGGPEALTETGVASVRPRLPGLPAPQPPEVLESPRPTGRPEAPLLAREEMPSPSRLGLADSAHTASMELLRLEDLAAANRDHAIVIPHQASRRDVAGYVNFTRLRLDGAGSDTAGALDGLARHVRDYTGILAQTSDKVYRYFVSEELLKDPVHFLIQGAGLASHRVDPLTRMREEEYALLDRYLRGGGFLFMEGSNLFLREMIAHLEKVLGQDGGVFEIPPTHPIYQSYYSFPSGFPGEDKRNVAEWDQRSWYYPGSSARELFEASNTQGASNPPQAQQQQEPAPNYLGLWGVELDGDLVGIVSDLGLHAKWIGNAGLDPDEPAEDTLPALMASTNILVYVLTRPRGLTPKHSPPAWVEKRPALALRPEDQAAPTGVLVDEELFADLDAYLALVQSPLGRRIDRAGLRVRLDGRYSLELPRGGMHALLLHNLPAGRHWVDLEYGGKSKQLEVDLRGGRVLTVTFSLNRIAFFSQLRLLAQEERVEVSSWLERFTDLQIEEVYLGEDRALLETAEEF